MSGFVIWCVDVDGRECERVDFRGGRKTYFATDKRKVGMRYLPPNEHALRKAIDEEIEKESRANS
jgi:hypothetical protein